MLDSLINWQDWSKDVFQQAREQDCLVLLLVERFWCSYSRLMSKVCWNNTDVARAVEENYIPVVVDGDRRPDVARRFKADGSPTVAFVTPEARPIAAGTFLPPEALINALENVASVYREKRNEVLGRITEIEVAEEAARRAAHDPFRRVSPWMASTVIETLEKLADRDFGGFGTAPKYPHFDAVELMFRLYERSGEQRFLQYAVNALDGMMHYGLMDWDSGGFYRCSDAQDWSSPQPEKLLFDQARHTELYLLGLKHTGDLEYKEAVQSLVEYLFCTLYDSKTGLFGASQAGEREVMEYGGGQTQISRGLDADPTVYLEGNIRTACALLDASEALQDRELALSAHKCFEIVTSKLAPKEELAYRYFDTEARLEGFLPDQVALGRGLLKFYSATDDVSLLRHAINVAEQIHDRFQDACRPGYFDSEDPMGLGKLSTLDKSFEDNMGLAQFFAQLSRITGDPVWLERAETAMNGFSGLWERVGIGQGAFGLALLEVYSEDDQSSGADDSEVSE